MQPRDEALELLVKFFLERGWMIEAQANHHIVASQPPGQGSGPAAVDLTELAGFLGQ